MAFEVVDARDWHAVAYVEAESEAYAHEQGARGENLHNLLNWKKFGTDSRTEKNKPAVKAGLFRLRNKINP